MYGGVPSSIPRSRGLSPLPLPLGTGSPLRLDLPPPPFPPSAALLDSPPPAGHPRWVLGLSCAMDAGGDARLPRKKGNTKRATPPPPAEREAGAGRGRDRFESLWHDYHDLLQETEAKKRRLERMHRRKLGLLAEVKFLRKKFSSFVNDDPQQTQYSLKNKKARQQIPSTLGMNEGPYTSKGTNMDLNQDSAMNGVGAGRQGYQDHSEPGRHDMAGVDEDIMNSNVNNLPGYRDTGNSPASDEKRATAWQDRVALKI